MPIIKKFNSKYIHNEEFKAKVFGFIGNSEEEGLHITESNIHLYPPLFTFNKVLFKNKAVGEVFKDKLTGLEESFSKFYDFMQTEPYFKTLFSKESERGNLLYKFCRENPEYMPAIDLLKDSDASKCFNRDTNYVDSSSYKLLFTKNSIKKTDFIKDSCKFIVKFNHKLKEYPENSEFIGQSHYTKVVLENLHSCLENIPADFTLQSFFNACGQHSHEFFMLLPSIVPVLPDAVNSFALASSFMILSHPFVIVDLGASSQYSVILQMTHRNLNPSLFQRISSRDIVLALKAQYINCTPFLVKKSILYQIMAPMDFQDRLYSLSNKFLKNNIKALLQISQDAIYNPKTSYINITDTLPLVSDILKDCK